MHKLDLWIPMFSCGLFAGCYLNNYFKIHTPDTSRLPWITSTAIISRHSRGQVSSVRSSGLGRPAVLLQARDYCALLPVLTPFLSLLDHHFCLVPSLSGSLRQPRKLKQTLGPCPHNRNPTLSQVRMWEHTQPLLSHQHVFKNKQIWLRTLTWV